MILRKLNASFGALDGRCMELRDGLNILQAPNESGKSTWCAFLVTMLYGLDTSARTKQGVQPDKLRYAPWSGTPMAGSMELEYEGRSITLRRWTERANAPMQAFSATWTGTDEPVPWLTASNAGETLTGVQREVFERSAFIRQAGMAVQGGAALEKRINAIVSSGEEDVSYSETDKRLRQWQRHRKSGSRGAIPETERSLSELEEKLQAGRECAARAAEIDGELERLRTERGEAVRRMERARAAQRKQALDELVQSRQRLRALEQERTEAAAACERAHDALRAGVFGDCEPTEARERVEDVKRRAAGLEQLARRTPPLWISFIFLGLFALAMVLALLLPWHSQLICAGAISLVLFALVFLRLNEMKKSAQGMLDDRITLLEGCGGTDEAAVDAALAAHEARWSEAEAAEAALAALDRKLDEARSLQQEADDELVAGLDFSHGDSEAARAGRAVEELDGRIEALMRQRAELEGRGRAGGDPVVLESEALAAKSRLAALQEEYDALTLAIETLAEADSELQGRFSPELSRRTAELFRLLTDGRYDSIELARDMSARVQPSGDVVSRGMDSLSVGTADQLYLALRLAVCELALPQEEPCPMILDDALVSFDEQRLERALALIRSIAERRQVLLFTCHEREARYFENDPAATLVPVGE